MNPFYFLFAFAALTVAVTSPVQASPKDYRPIDVAAQAPYPTQGAAKMPSARELSRQRAHVLDGGIASLNLGTSYLPHPSGCPRRLFCACGAATRLFGSARRDLWPVRAWYRFPRAAPAAGRAALRPGHMFVLEYQVSGDIWMTADYNSGGHQSRMHAQSIRGYTIVDPNGNAATFSARKIRTAHR